MIPYRMNPLGISVNENIPLTFTAQQAGSTVKLIATGSPTVSGLHYRLGKSGEWLTYTIGNTITLANVGDSIQFWNSASTLSSSNGNFVQFVVNGQVSGQGNTMSLLNWSDTCPDYCFYELFRDVPITSPAELPALTLGQSCYSGAYRDSLLARPPKLPANVLQYACYNLMLFACPLEYAPELPALTPAASCYTSMLRNTTIPSVHIRLTSLNVTYALRMALAGCSNLTQIEVDFTSWGNDSTSTDSWVENVAASGTFIKPTALPEEYGANRIPTGWTVVNK